MSDQVLLYRIAALQFGLFTLSQAEACGVNRHRLARMIRQGICERLHPGVFRLCGVPASWESAAHAAVLVADSQATLALLPDEERLPRHQRREIVKRKAARLPVAVLSHSWAMRAHGGDRVTPTGRPEVCLRSGHIPKYDGVIVHRTRALEPIDVQWVRGIPCTSGARTVIDLATRLPDTQAMALTDDMICARRTTRPHLHRRAAALRKGRAGADVVERITSPDAEGTFWSWLERTFDDVVRAHDLPVPSYNVPLRDERALSATPTPCGKRTGSSPNSSACGSTRGPRTARATPRKATATPCSGSLRCGSPTPTW